MKWQLVFLSLFVPALAVQPAAAGIFFGKSAKPNPAERVPVLIGTLRTDKEEHKRVSAAKELRDYDPTAFPDIMPTLIDTVQHDPKPAVRAEAAQSLGKLRPITQEAGQALEQAVANDPSMRVRLQARTSLWNYHFAGYRSSKKRDELLVPVPDKSHPAAQHVAPVPQPSISRVPFLSRVKGGVIPGETPPPPLAPELAPVISTTPLDPRVPRPLPQAPPLPVDQGPELTPPA